MTRGIDSKENGLRSMGMDTQQDFKKNKKLAGTHVIEPTEETHIKGSGKVGSAPESIQSDNESVKRMPYDGNGGNTNRFEKGAQSKLLNREHSDENDIAKGTKRKYKNNDPRLIYTSAKQE